MDIGKKLMEQERIAQFLDKNLSRDDPKCQSCDKEENHCLLYQEGHECNRSQLKVKTISKGKYKIFYNHSQTSLEESYNLIDHTKQHTYDM